ncbi:MAG: glycosyl hydrolase [Verrucomicrobiia bacterium]
MRLLLSILTLLAVASPVAASELRRVFLEPPDEAKPRGYWVWPHGNFDYAAMRHELAEFKSKGLGGVDIFDLGVRDPNKVIPPGPGFLSVEQVDGIAFALEEAKRLGLKMGLIVSSSWNAGGTWTPPEHASMNLVAWRETNTGPLRLERALPLPELPESFRKTYGTFPLHVPKDKQGRPQYLKDVAVLAYPLDAEGRVPGPDHVRVLNDQMDAAGKLTCDLPSGRWVVMRAVLANFGQRLWLPSARSQGLTMDHFSREATRHHFRTVMDRLEARVGPLKDTALERLYLASYEANADVIWTPGFEAEFARANGYRIEPFLPALFGVEVNDPETTERFLYDYRRTVSELFVNNLYREASRLCRERGLLLCSEAGGPGAPLHDVPTEDLKALGAVDVMRGEFWNGRTEQLTPDGFEELQVVKPVASAAHIYGHRIVEMEAFTSFLNWQEGPNLLRPLADRAFCEGMTRVVYHTMSHNLPEAGRPGWTYQAGTQINTHLTWWELSGQFHAYLARCSALLMQGQFVADVAYYSRNDIPSFAKPKHIRPGLGYGYDYDDLNTEVLLQAKADRRGRIVLPSGMSYAVLVLPAHDRRMDLTVLRHLERLVKQGATILGERPERTYGLRGFPAEERQLRELAARLWGDSAPAGPQERKVGRGRLGVGQAERDVLRGLGLGPDFEVSPVGVRPQLDFIHRRTEHEDIYFLRNASSNAVRFEAVFRVRGKHPELWDAVRGTMTPAGAFVDEREGIRLPVHLDGHGSVFVVFTPPHQKQPPVVEIRHEDRLLFPDGTSDGRAFEVIRETDGAVRFRASEPGEYHLHLSDGSTRRVTVPPELAPLELEGPWEVRFPLGWDVPTRQQFARLHSWTESTNGTTVSFSGIGTYVKQFSLPADRLASGQRVWLDLGEVREVARIFVNGREAGHSSFAPHLIDVTGLVRPGENSLVIEVANTWLNRLRADDALPEAHRRTHTNLPGPAGGQRWRAVQPQPSGLLGPVRLHFPRYLLE